MVNDMTSLWVGRSALRRPVHDASRSSPRLLDRLFLVKRKGASKKSNRSFSTEFGFHRLFKTALIRLNRVFLTITSSTKMTDSTQGSESTACGIEVVEFRV